MKVELMAEEGTAFAVPSSKRCPSLCPTSSERAQVRDDEFRFVDEQGNEYRYRVDEQGNAIVVDCTANDEILRVPELLGGRRVVEIGDAACSSSVALSRAGYLGDGDVSAPTGPTRGFIRPLSRNGNLRIVVLPDGVKRIGKGAFRGCGKLSEVILPESLVEIDDLAFSCTALSALAVPASCTRLTVRALRLGPETVSGEETPYRSKLRRLSVETGNPAYRMAGGMLCRIESDGRLTAMLAPGSAAQLDLTSGVTGVHAGAFAGTTRVETLRVRNGCLVEHAGGLLPAGTCETLIVEPGLDETAGKTLVLCMPRSASSKTIVVRGTSAGRVNAQGLADAYDEALISAGDRLEQAKLMLARLAAPVLLREEWRIRFVDALTPSFDSLCVHFGARAYWEGFDHMVDAGLLDEGLISRAVSMLTQRGDTPASAYLLKLRQMRFAPAGWDSYAL